MSDLHAKISSGDETVVRKLLRQASSRSRARRAYSAVPFGRETDANREFATNRESGTAVWFFTSLTMFVIAYFLSMKIGAI
jgi:hypothetical protein